MNPSENEHDDWDLYQSLLYLLYLLDTLGINCDSLYGEGAYPKRSAFAGKYDRRTGYRR